MRNPIVPILTITLAVVAELWALAPGADAPPILQAEQLMVERKFDDVLAHLRATVEQYRADNPAISAMAQYRLGLYLGYIKQHSPDRQYWLGQIEAELRKVEVDFPAQIEAVSLARIKLIDALLGQRKLDEARQVAQILVETTTEWPEYNAWGRLKLVQISHTVTPGMKGKQIAAIQRAAIPQLQEVIAFSQAEVPEVANWARIGLLDLRTQLLTPTTTSAEFDDLIRVCADVLADHSAGRIGDKQAGWALVLEAKAFVRQKRFEEAAGPLQMAMAVTDPNHLDVKYMAEGELRGVYCKMVERDYLAAQEARKKDDRVGARALLAEAYDRVGPAGGLHRDDILKGFAQLAESNGDYDEAIAWYRLLIRDPKKIEGPASEAVETIARLYSTRDQIGNELTWRMYLLDPVQSEDPTASLVSTFVGVQAPVASDAPLQNVAQRHIALGKLYRREGRLPEARTAFEQALSVAAVDRERAEALLRLAPYWRKAEGREVGLQTAKQASDLWLNELERTRSDGDAHCCIEKAFSSYDHAGFPQETIALLEQLVASMSPDIEPARACFARYYLINKYVCYSRDAEAKALAEETTELFRDRVFAQGHDWLCSRVLIYLAHLYAREGDSVSSARALDEVESRWPQLAESVASHRLVLQDSK